MELDAAGRPRFMAASAPLVSASPVPDDVWWDDRFSNYGINGTGSPAIYAIAVSGTDVYVGGSFTAVGKVPASYIAKWNTLTNTWSGLGASDVNGVNSYVIAIAVSGSDVYVGGTFSAANNSANSTVNASMIAKWNGSAWSAGATDFNGVNNQVHDIAINGSDVYVGGYFTQATNSENNTVSTNYVAKWNGTAWSTLGSGDNFGVNSPVYALALDGSNLYVGGSFTSVALNNVPANYIARWDGASWTPLGSGLNNQVNALGISSGFINRRKLHDGGLQAVA